MIPVNRLLTEMEKQLLAAKQAGNEQSVREALSAIRSLCEVALSANSFGSQEPAVQHTPSLEAYGKLEEEDANGDSIFDF